MSSYPHVQGPAAATITLTFTPVDYAALQALYERHVAYCKAKGWSCGGFLAFVEGLVLDWVHTGKGGVSMDRMIAEAAGCDIPF